MTVGFWRQHSQIYITYNWVKQESIIYVDGEKRFIIPLQPGKRQHTMDKQELLQNLETALRLREEAAHQRNLARYLYEQTLSSVLVEIADVLDREDIRMLATIQTINSHAAVDKRCHSAFIAYLEAERQHTHTEDTVTLIQAEISLWRKGKAPPDES